MKKQNIMKSVFTILGALMLIGCFFLYRSTNTFLKKSITAQGTVVDLIATYSNSSSSSSRNYSSRSRSHFDDDITYKPLIEFIDKKGKTYEFASSTSSRPPSYFVGEKVEVLYNPQSPHNAKIKGFFSLWGGVSILGGIGFIFFLIGFSSFIKG